MKRIIIVVMMSILIMSAASLTVFAKSGDVAGYTYYTDIKATVNSAPINVLNICGKTVIDAEALNWHYGFGVYWYAEERKLEIIDKGTMFASLQALAGERLEEIKGAPGEKAGRYFETDIITYLNGREIESYNIGGRTFIVTENMRDYGYDVIWNEETRTFAITKSEDFYVSKTELGNLKLLYDPIEETKNKVFREIKRGVYLHEDSGKVQELKTPSNRIIETFDGITYVALSDLVQIFEAECVLKESTETISSSFEPTYTKCNYIIEFNYDSNIMPGINEEADYDCESIELDLSSNKCEEISCNDVALHINRENIGMPAMYAGKVFNASMFVVNGKIYVPTRVVAELLNYYAAT